MSETRQLIYDVHKDFELIKTYYDLSKTSQLKQTEEQLKNFEIRWSTLIDNLEKCSSRVKIFFVFLFSNKSIDLISS